MGEVDKRDAPSAASALGRMAKGIPKRYSEAELDLRRRRLAEARKARWPEGRKNRERGET